MNARSARLTREVKNLNEKPPWGIICYPEKESDHNSLLALLKGPKGSPYESGNFKILITIPEQYPFEPPLLKFQTPIYHPNIDKEGRICMDMLKMPPTGSWLPTITLETLLVSLQTLLACPNPDDPLMMDIAQKYKYDKEGFIKSAKWHTEKYAMN
ncbi:Ubiquitin-conjugating enzyme E2 T [Eumeta japonica]|uniref:Ubiquitin-conjugating enzyme E2 T n=1 Tax=Eumeta variegata TaxID=151549 RepID=A0A4C1ZG73_EUMVA|nr:Ubiquitin-conjugating enzyme E2 T [Eumeta japonica]